MYWLVFLLSISWATFLQGAPLQVAIKSRSAVLINMETGAVLFTKEPHLKAFPASITKIATALTFLERGETDLQRQVPVSTEALRQKSFKRPESLLYGLEPDGTMLGLKVGERVSLEWLLHGMMLVSGNDAANLLAEVGGGSVTQFVEAMNLFAKQLGCTHTQFCNPHGLHHVDHYTTAHDMALIARRAMQIPLFREIVSKASYRACGWGAQGEREIRQMNPLMRRGGPFYYPKAIGVKTGTTSQATALVAAAVDQGRTLIAVILGSEKKEDRYEDAKLLFETAFAEKKIGRFFLEGKELFTRNLTKDRKVTARLARRPSIQCYPSEEPKCRVFIHWAPLPLPIQKGQKVGEVHVVDEQGTLCTREDLIATQAVLPTYYERFLQFLK